RRSRPAGGRAAREPRGLDRASEVHRRPRAPLPHPPLRRRVTLSFYIYYRVPAQNAERARVAVRELQRELSDIAGISGRLLRRRDDETTWMEIYENVQDGARFEAELAKLVERRIPPREDTLYGVRPTRCRAGRGLQRLQPARGRRRLDVFLLQPRRARGARRAGRSRPVEPPAGHALAQGREGQGCARGAARWSFRLRSAVRAPERHRAPPRQRPSQHP